VIVEVRCSGISMYADSAYQKWYMYDILNGRDIFLEGLYRLDEEHLSSALISFPRNIDSFGVSKRKYKLCTVS
jgi:hypothetical protein